MKTYRIVRKIDKLGRIVVPKDMRDFYGMDTNTALEIIAVDDGVLIKALKDKKRQKQ